MRAQINHARRTATSFDIKVLKALGYQQIGRGAFSRALVHPDAPDVVVKVGTFRSRYRHLSRHKDGFPLFARHILKGHTSSKFYPKIYELREDGTNFLCIMKRYEKLPGRRTSGTLTQTAIKLAGRHTYGQFKPDLRRFGRALSPFRFFNFDLHAGNVMQDHRGTPIIIDPITMRA